METAVKGTSELDDDLLSTESFFMTCKLVGLTIDDMEHMTIGNCLDYAESYLELKSGKKKDEIRKANQDDFDSF